MKSKFATRAFNDAGTGRAFAAGEEISDVEAGVVANYEAAGLVSDDGEAVASADTFTTAVASAAAATADETAPVKRKAAPRRRKAAATS
jgi:hypothetical protein